MVQVQIEMEYEQDEKNKNEDQKNIEYLHIMLIHKFHLNKHQEFVDNELLMKINLRKKRKRIRKKKSF